MQVEIYLKDWLFSKANLEASGFEINISDNNCTANIVYRVSLFLLQK